MKSILFLIVSVLISFALSCVPEANYDTYSNEGKSSYSRERKSPVSINHTFELQVVDINDKQVPEAMVKFCIKNGNQENIVKDSLAYTDSKGKFSQKAQVNPEPTNPGGDSDYVFFLYEVSKEGYFPKNGMLSSTFSLDSLQKANLQEAESMRLWSIMQTHQRNMCMIDDKILGEGDSIKGFKVSQIGDSFVKLESEGATIILRQDLTYPEIIQRSTGQREIKSAVESKKVRLIRPIDYFKPSFLSSTVGKELKDKILPFLETGFLKSPIDSYMGTRSIDLVTFKGKKYLKFKFVGDKVYNSLRLNKYDIAKIFFDEVIRKILTPLNSHMSGSTQFYGYDLTVIGHTKSFINEHVMPTSIEYRFIMPQVGVRMYKDKNISGQDLLNQSIIVMDDERIELKLQ
jgi:hypothetical protein